MGILAVPDRLASASAVFFGHRGDVSRSAQQRGVSRQRLYREADGALRDLEGPQHQQQLAHLRQHLACLQARLASPQADQPYTIVLGPDKQAEFTCCAQAEGVSLPVARRLLAVFLGDNTPSVATLGRRSRQAGLRAGLLLAVLDDHTRPRIQQACADETFFGQKPVLMVVEPESLCWVSGRLSASRDGEQWARELGQLPALEHLVRDGGQGLHNGLSRVNDRRRQADRPVIGDQLDHFHTPREGGRALRKTQAQAERAWGKAEAADRSVAKRARQGQARTGYQTQALLRWRQAEEALNAWSQAEQACQQIQQALRPFTPQGELNTRPKAQEAVEAVLPRLHGEQWDKFKRLLRQPQTYTYLERWHQQAEALPVAQEVREAVVRSEGVRQNPELVRGEAARAGVPRGLLVVWGLLIHLAGAAGRQAVQALRQLTSRAGRASSCVEGLNSVVRMQQGRHRKVTQGLLDLKRLYWNLRTFRTGRRRKTNPYARLGVPLPPDLSWWQLLQLTPDQLRTLLSAQPPPP